MNVKIINDTIYFDGYKLGLVAPEQGTPHMLRDKFIKTMEMVCTHTYEDELEDAYSRGYDDGRAWWSGPR